MNWIKDFKPNYHSFLGGSHYSWINYDVEKFIQSYIKWKNRPRTSGINIYLELGSDLHKFADSCIKSKTKLLTNDTISMYVNDSIAMNMESEQLLYFSTRSFGTCDSILFEKEKLNIHDLKTGITKSSFHQLEIYAAYFCLNYDISPKDIEIELRIYQTENVYIKKAELPEIIPIMDKIVTFDKIIFDLEEKYVYLT